MSEDSVAEPLISIEFTCREAYSSSRLWSSPCGWNLPRQPEYLHPKIPTRIFGLTLNLPNEERRSGLLQLIGLHASAVLGFSARFLLHGLSPATDRMLRAIG